MQKLSKGDLTFYTFDIFPKDEIQQGIFTRCGGVSPAPWASLNTAGTVGDVRENIVENRRRIFAAIDRPVETIFDVWQVHSNSVILTDQPRPLDQPHQKGDAILTQNPEVTLFMRFADCVPIFLYDPKTYVVGVVHAGWQGTINKVVQAAVQSMYDVYHCQYKNILAGIGPSIGPDHYEIGPEVENLVSTGFGIEANNILIRKGEKTYLDLWQANRILLIEKGIENIEMAEMCTACDTQNWFSHRGDHGKTGRFGAVIALTQ